MEEINILGIVGSLCKHSYNRAVLKSARALAPNGTVLHLFELNGIPVYNQGDELAPPPAVQEFKRQILSADAILFATPEYNYSVPRPLKNAINWASRPNGESAWMGKPAAVMGASPGSRGSARAHYHLRQMLDALEMHLVNQPEVIISDAAQRFDADGRLMDEAARQRIQRLLSALVELVIVSRDSSSQMIWRNWIHEKYEKIHSWY